MKKEGINKVSRVPSLDGWRAFSICLVALSHFEYASGFPDSMLPYFKIFDGNLGVRIFFIISGFIITYIILNNFQCNLFSYSNFVYNRALRILPVYCSYLLLVFFLQCIGLIEEHLNSWLGCVFFIRNFVGRGDSLTIHFWSLSIEEQFYFVFPLLIVFFRKWTLVFFLGVVLFISVILRMAGVSNDYTLMGRIVGGRSTFLYLDSISIGCALGYLYFKNKKIFSFKYSNWACVGLLVLVGCRILLGKYFFMESYLGSLFDAIFFGLLIAFSVSENSILYWFLNISIVRFIGVLSYSFYVWHALFLSKLHGFEIPYLSIWYIFWIPSLLFAWLSWKYIEQTMIRFKRKW